MIQISGRRVLYFFLLFLVCFGARELLFKISWFKGRFKKNKVKSHEEQEQLICEDFMAKAIHNDRAKK